jgi:superfamily I DNA/RNA helicase
MSNSEEISVRIDYTEAVLLGSWDTLKDYIKNMEVQLQQATKNFEEWEKKKLAKLPAEQHEEFREAFIEEYINYYQEFPRILRNSMLVSACSLLEYQLGVICSKIKAHRDIPIGWGELKGDPLARAKT